MNGMVSKKHFFKCWNEELNEASLLIEKERIQYDTDDSEIDDLNKTNLPYDFLKLLVEFAKLKVLRIVRKNP
jgi:hypothetical protein